jgi:hypothetical protein
MTAKGYPLSFLVNVKLSVSKPHTLKTAGIRVKLHALLTSVVDEGGLLVSHSDSFIVGQSAPNTNLVRGCVVPEQIVGRY